MIGAAPSEAPRSGAEPVTPKDDPREEKIHRSAAISLGKPSPEWSRTPLK